MSLIRRLWDWMVQPRPDKDPFYLRMEERRDRTKEELDRLGAPSVDPIRQRITGGGLSR